LDILNGNLDRLLAQNPDQEVKPANNLPQTPAHENIRGAEYYNCILTDESEEQS
jgi:hypothetical protein